MFHASPSADGTSTREQQQHRQAHECQFLSISSVIDIMPTSCGHLISFLVFSTSCQEDSNIWRVVQRQVGTWNLKENGRSQ